MSCRSIYYCGRCGRETPWGKSLCDGCRRPHYDEPRYWICCNCRTDNPWGTWRCEACDHEFDGGSYL